MGKKRAQDAPAAEVGEVVAVVREWTPQHDDGLARIHEAIDSWGARPAEPAAPTRDHAQVAAAVDRITRRVKTRKVTVQETVTEYVEEELPAADGMPAAEAPAPVEEPRRQGKRKPRILGWLGPRSQKEKVDEALEERAQQGTGGEAGYQPQCMALTDGNAQCLNSAREGSKYCASHKGYQPPTAKGIAQRVEGEAWDPADKVTDQATVRSARTKPKVRKARDTGLAVRKAKGAKGRKKR